MREKICLNGMWDFMPVYGVTQSLELPDKAEFEAVQIQVPSSWRYTNQKGFGVIDDFRPFHLFNTPEAWHQAETGLYRRFFATPDHDAGDLFFLQFKGIMQRARFYLNGSPVGDWDDSYLPFETDVTAWLNPAGQNNELMVVCTGFEETVIASGQTKTLGLKGSWFGNVCRGIWQDVFLVKRPRLYLEDVTVQTSVTHRRLTVRVMVRNSHDAERECRLYGEVLDGSLGVLRLPEENLRIPAEGTAEMAWVTEWENPEFWSPEHPKLYVLDVRISQAGGASDATQVRFGFREFSAEGSQFLLNGVPINLRGDSWHFQGAIQQSKAYAENWYRMCRQQGLNFVRLHAEPHPEEYLEAADETGMLIVDETAIYGSSKSMDAAHPEFIETCRKHVQRLVRRDRNHPSVILWSMQNEMRWVDGRDVYKMHIPSLMASMQAEDSTRMILLEGDNRLLDKSATQVDSLHYNIDGTMAQWTRERPLIFGEHGGWWYICPQNSSAYGSAGVYQNFSETLRGVAFKERLYVESARREGVSGITSFNFAHYLMRSMPDHEVTLPPVSPEQPGVHPVRIPRGALTLNNGALKDYPEYIPNEAMRVLAEAYRPVAVIAAEYDRFFYTGETLHRSFDVYNDTPDTREATLHMTLREEDGTVIASASECWEHPPAQRRRVLFSAVPGEAQAIRKVILELVLYHGQTEQCRVEKIYRLCPSAMKTRAVEHSGKRLLYVGEDDFGRTLQSLVPGTDQTDQLSDAVLSYDILVVGPGRKETADRAQGLIGQFVRRGGRVIFMEQNSFVPGDMQIFRHPFFSARITSPACAEHPMFQGLSDEDFIFWKPGVTEEVPEPMLMHVLKKPAGGDTEILMECSTGDFGDGGDFWTPLLVRYEGQGFAVFCQFEIAENFESVPQACLLLRNMLAFAAHSPERNFSQTLRTDYRQTRLAALEQKTGLIAELFSEKKAAEVLRHSQVLIADPDALEDEMLYKVRQFLSEGGTLVMLPCEERHEAMLRSLTGVAVSVRSAPTFQLRPRPHLLTRGFGVTDLFRYEKIPLTPRRVENIPVCRFSLTAGGADTLVVQQTGTPWHDFFERNLSAEYSRIYLADKSRRQKEEEHPYVSLLPYGPGRIVFCQIEDDFEQEKNIRIYTALLSALGCRMQHEPLFSYVKGKEAFAADYLMGLKAEPWQDTAAMEAYFTDSGYSLNNLGEGLYGWMKKTEKDRDGWIRVYDSTPEIYFFTCFVYIGDGGLCVGDVLEVEASRQVHLWINGISAGTPGHALQAEAVLFRPGLNRLAMKTEPGHVPLKLRVVFRHADGTFPVNVRYRLTLDEVEPK